MSVNISVTFALPTRALAAIAMTLVEMKTGRVEIHMQASSRGRFQLFICFALQTEGRTNFSDSDGLLG